jgi:manganese/zinc/iron transport system substrate-binding protein
MITKHFRILFLFTIFALVLSACSGSSASVDNIDMTQRQIRVTTTIGMISDIVKNIGGERVAVTGLMGPGVDPHLFKASEGDLRALEKADLIFYNGLHLEAGMASLLERMGEQKRVIAVTNGIDKSMLLASPVYAGAYDPHVWFDVRLWKLAAEKVRDTLVELDPGSADLYQKNAAAYLAELEVLDNYVRQQAERVPPDKRVLITAHDAFSYFGKSYGYEVRGLQGISTQAEAGTSDVQELASFIVERQIPAVFIETSIPRRNIEAVQAAVNARGFAISIGGELFSDAMGDPDGPAGTYAGMVRHNIDTITAALLMQPSE